MNISCAGIVPDRSDSTSPSLAESTAAVDRALSVSNLIQASNMGRFSPRKDLSASVFRPIRTA